MKPYLLFLSAFFLALSAQGQDLNRKIEFPDVDSFLTLKCDLHIHTVFSDGHVWPTIRVQEAVKDGLDAISLTEHIEYQPWKDDIPNLDRNRSYEIAKEVARPHNLIVIHGTEITRDMPPGHANALFVKDVNELVLEDSLEAYQKARAQGAFIFWNHPNWINQQKDGIPFVSPFHDYLIKNDLLHGIEVVNDLTFSEEALKIANERNLTVMGTSDIHGLVDYQFRIAEGGHRPINLVFARERTEEGIKEALFAGRAVAWFDNILTGKEPNMRMLVDASLLFKWKGYIGDSEVLEIEVKNVSDAKFILQNTSIYDFQQDTDVIEILPQSTKILQVIASRSEGEFIPLTFTILNAVIGYKKQLEISIPLNN
jgi:3',5'-nucleoside bisphosphate phosphatase